jgi:hypothetical protein
MMSSLTISQQLEKKRSMNPPSPGALLRGFHDHLLNFFITERDFKMTELLRLPTQLIQIQLTGSRYMGTEMMLEVVIYIILLILLTEG